MRKFIVTLLVLFSVFAVYANTLFENGKSSYSIVLPPNANPTEKFAAEELQSLLKKSGNVTLPIVQAPASKGHNIFIKTVPNGKKLEVRDQITIKYDQGDLILQGNFSYCALFAVYRFAEKQLGFRWLYPGEAGEFYTPKSKLVLSEDVSEVFIPKIRIRAMFQVWGRSLECEKWILHNYGNIGIRSEELLAKVDVPRFYVSAFAELRGRNKDLFKTDPELFSLRGGKRVEYGWGGCWTNPRYMDLYVKEVFERIEKEKFDLLFLVAPDTTIRCQCANCNAEKSIPDRWTNFFRIVSKRIKERYPDIKLATCAYHEYRELPKGDIRFADYAPSFSFSNRCYIHNLNDPKCPYQAKALGMIDSWKKKFGGDVSVNCYENAVFIHYSSFAPMLNMLIDQMKYFAKLDPQLLRTELYVIAPWARFQKWDKEFNQYSLYRLTNYIFVTMMHSPEVDGKQLFREYCDTLYGPAGDVMYKYHTEIADAWSNMDTHLVYYFHNPGIVSQKMLTPELIVRFNTYFAYAEKIVRSKPEYKRYIKEVALDKFNFEQWVKCYNSYSVSAWKFPVGKGKNKPYKFTMKTPDGSKGKKKSLMKTSGTIARDDNFLYIHVDCFNIPGVKLVKGEKTRDNRNLFKSENVEFLIRTDQQSASFRFAVNPAGGFCDIRRNDFSWNPSWEVKTAIKKDRWTADMVIPFRELGYEGHPMEGAAWSIGARRYVNNANIAGFPIPASKKITETARMIFDPKASPEKVITHIVSKKPKADFSLDLNADGWVVNKETFKAGWNKRSENKEVILLTPGTVDEAPLSFYRNRIDSALDNGGLVIFSDDGKTNWQALFGKEFPLGYFRYKQIDPSEKLTWADRKSTPEENKKWSTILFTAGPAIYNIPSAGWHILATQKLSNGKDAPVMMYKQHRKGMIALILHMEFIPQKHFTGFLEFLIKRWEKESAGKR